MFCTKCGSQNYDEAMFCTTCGAQLGSGGAVPYVPNIPQPGNIPQPVNMPQPVENANYESKPNQVINAASTSSATYLNYILGAAWAILGLVFFFGPAIAITTFGKTSLSFADLLINANRLNSIVSSDDLMIIMVVVCVVTFLIFFGCLRVAVELFRGKGFKAGETFGIVLLIGVCAFFLLYLSSESYSIVGADTTLWVVFIVSIVLHVMSVATNKKMNGTSMSAS